MWHLNEGGPESAREIDAFITELVGPQRTHEFWHTYRENYITQQDIHFIKQCGFNSIRVPLHYKFFETDTSEGFTLLDHVIQWAGQENLYVILDLHAAPGGQTGKNIDDSDGYPWLFSDASAQQHTIAIWQRLARHYRNNSTVLGYDLLNEPVPNYPRLEPLESAVEPLYKRLASAIRQIDTHHILILGGAEWDGNFAIFGPPFDKNVFIRSIDITLRQNKRLCRSTLTSATRTTFQSGLVNRVKIRTNGLRSSCPSLRRTISDGPSGRIKRCRRRPRWSALRHLRDGTASFNFRRCREPLQKRPHA